MRFWTCDVRRDQLAHYQCITHAGAFAQYLRLEEIATLAHPSLPTTDDLRASA